MLDYSTDVSLLDVSTDKVRDTKWKHSLKPYITYPYRGMLSSSERHLLYEYSKIGGNIAELGSFRGYGSSAIIWGMFHGNGGNLYLVDNFGSKNCYWNNDDIGCEDTPSILAEYVSGNHMTDKIILNICKGDTYDWGLRLKDLAFNFVFIDADHSYEGCKRDFTAWEPMVQKGGLIGFHDTHSTGVNRVIKELNGFTLIEHIFSLKLFRKD